MKQKLIRFSTFVGNSWNACYASISVGKLTMDDLLGITYFWNKSADSWIKLLRFETWHSNFIACA